MTHLHLTAHAIQRWHERISARGGLAGAGAALAIAASHAWPIPRRIAHELIPRLTDHRDSRWTDYYVAPGALLLTHSHRVVTVLPLPLDRLADLVVWSIWGRLPDRVSEAV